MGKIEYDRKYYETHKEYYVNYHLQHKAENNNYCRNYYQMRKNGEKVKKIRYLVSNGENSKEFDTMRELVKFMGFSDTYLRACIDNKKALCGYTIEKIFYKGAGK